MDGANGSGGAVTTRSMMEEATAVVDIPSLLDWFLGRE
jgi:hypothetical protein